MKHYVCGTFNRTYDVTNLRAKKVGCSLRYSKKKILVFLFFPFIPQVLVTIQFFLERLQHFKIITFDSCMTHFYNILENKSDKNYNEKVPNVIKRYHWSHIFAKLGSGRIRLIGPRQETAYQI